MELGKDILETEIKGLRVKTLKRFVDERGDFREIVRTTDPGFQGFSQLSTSVVYEGIAKAWHLHWDQTESMTCFIGIVKFAFCDRRKESSTYNKVIDFVVDSRANPMLFTFEPGIAHGYRVIHGPAVIGYLTNRIYDPKDQFRVDPNSPDINYFWGPPAVV